MTDTKTHRSHRSICHWPSLVVVLVSLLAVSGNVLGQITLDGDFDHGGLDEANSSVNGSMVTLAGRDNFNPGEWKWLYFSANNVNGLQPTFEIGDNFVTGGSDLEDHDMVYSYDQQTWFFFDNNDRNAAQNTYTFSNNSAFTQNEVFVAYGLPYSRGRAASHTAGLVASPWVTPTTSGNSSLVIGQSPGGVDDLGRVVSPSDIYGYKITDPSATGPKKKIAMISGVHSNETHGNYTLEGLINFLVSDDLEAGMLRKEAEFFVYPMVNPDGRFAGYNRSTVENVLLDPNRFWDSPNYGGLSDVKVVGDALLADTGGDVDYFIDFHSSVADKLGHYGFVLPSMQSDPFWTTLLGIDSGVSTRNASLINLTAAKFGRDELNAEFTTTFETEFLAGENIDRLHELGQNFGLAFQQIFTLFGDLNFDDVLDTQDWQLFIAGAETDLSGLTDIEAYVQGDLDGDGVNSGIDFGIFKAAYEAENGTGSFAQMLAQVPEPSTVSITLLGTLFFSTFLGRQSNRNYTTNS